MENHNNPNPTAGNPAAQPVQMPPGRPVFLTILCVLSFLGVALSLVWNGISYVGMTIGTAVMQESQVVGNLEEATENVPLAGISIREVFGFLEHVPAFALVNVFAALIVLAGVILMWNLRKAGYYIYIVGELLPLIALVALGGVLGSFFAATSSVFALLFIVLYGLNLKYMY